MNKQIRGKIVTITIEVLVFCAVASGMVEAAWDSCNGNCNPNHQVGIGTNSPDLIYSSGHPGIFNVLQIGDGQLQHSGIRLQEDEGSMEIVVDGGNLLIRDGSISAGNSNGTKFIVESGPAGSSVGIGTTDAKLQYSELEGTYDVLQIGGGLHNHSGIRLQEDEGSMEIVVDGGNLHIRNGATNANNVYGTKFTVQSGGKIGIGTLYPDSLLTVNGKIHATEVNVDTSIVASSLSTDEMIVKNQGWADFVFSNDYKLMSLEDLEKSVKSEKHLPGIPTAEEVSKEGVNVGKMQAMLLQKIEELTLYVIDQDKKLSRLEKENQEMKKRISLD